MIFACMPAYGKDEGKAILLAHSLRQWGGRFSDAVLLILEPETSRLSPSSCEALTRLGATIVPFPLPETALSFPYAQKVFAAAAAEQIAGGELLAWMDPDSLILFPPEEFDLPPGKNRLQPGAFEEYQFRDWRTGECLLAGHIRQLRSRV